MDYQDWTIGQLNAEILSCRARIHDCRERGWEATARTYRAELTAISRELAQRKVLA